MPNFQIVALADQLTQEQIAAFKQIIPEHENVQIIGDVSISKEHGVHCACCLVEMAPNTKRSLMKSLAKQFIYDYIDIICRPVEQFEANYQLAVFDMDSTLIKAEIINELAKEAGVGEQVSEITARAMEGEINFRESFTERLSLLKGLSEAVLEKVLFRLPLMDGIQELCKFFKERKIKTAIISGGFDYFAEKLKNLLPMDECFSHHLMIKDGKLAGKINGEIIDGERKLEILTELVKTHRLDFQNVVVVGDGANDIPMINAAGMGVAYHAKPVVQEQTDHNLQYVDMRGLIYLL